MTVPRPAYSITSYDLLKTFAVVIMIIDHIGYYFFPDDLWWRAVGRIGFPVWFFLIGYARGRSLHWHLWVGAGLLLAGNLVSGMYIFPLNALVTIIILRLILDAVMKMALHDGRALFAFSLVFFLLAVITNTFVEYGTLALIMAMMGYMVRHGAERAIPRDVVIMFSGFAFAGFVAVQHFLFRFPAPQLAFVAIGTAAVMIVLYRFRGTAYAGLTARLPQSLTAVAGFCGRHTLAIYVAHLMLFKGLGMALAPERFPPLGFTLFYR